jgi:hypothetical protein
MGKPSIGIVIPTVDGREADLERCLAAYESTAAREGVAVHCIVVTNRPTCGIAWQQGADHLTSGAHFGTEAEGAQAVELRGGVPDYLHFTADDLEPLPGWATAAIDACNSGAIPAPLVYGPDGLQVQSAGGAGDGVLYTTPPPPGEPVAWCAVPFMRTADWLGDWIGAIGPMVPLHYYTDDWFSYRAGLQGLPIRFTPGYAFRHYDAAPGRGAGFTQAERAARDRADYRKYVSGKLPLEGSPE